MNRPVTLALTGDVMLRRGVDETLQRLGPAHPWGDLLPVLNEADLTVVNLACVIARGGRPWSRWPKVFHFRGDPVALRALQCAGVDCVTLANNHILDYEEEAMLNLLQQGGIAGAGRNLEAARQPALLEALGMRVGIVAFTDDEPGWAAQSGVPGTNDIPKPAIRREPGPTGLAGEGRHPERTAPVRAAPAAGTYYRGQSTKRDRTPCD